MLARYCGPIALCRVPCAAHTPSIGYPCKWHAGLYTDELHPVGRGFNHSLGFMAGSEDHYTQRLGKKGVDLWRDHAPAYGENGTYSTFWMTTEATKQISQHASTHTASTPMVRATCVAVDVLARVVTALFVSQFMYLAYQECHCPLQVPDSYQDKSIGTKLRRIYHGMAKCLDEGTHNPFASFGF